MRVDLYGTVTVKNLLLRWMHQYQANEYVLSERLKQSALIAESGAFGREFQTRDRHLKMPEGRKELKHCSITDISCIIIFCMLCLYVCFYILLYYCI